jgi:hypothetical protein
MPKKNYLAALMAIVPFVTPAGRIQSGKGQGIEGFVYRVSGNQMPSPDIKRLPRKGIRTTLFIYGLTNRNQTVKRDQGPFYESLQTSLVKRVETNDSGYFKVQLPVGRYSLFAKKDSLFFANWFDGNNNIAPVDVVARKMTKIEFKIDYDASY